MTADVLQHPAADPPVILATEAARLCGCKHAAQFLREVRAGHWPKPLPISSRPKRWSRAAILKRVAELAGEAPSSSPVGDPLAVEMAQWSM